MPFAASAAGLLPADLARLVKPCRAVLHTVVAGDLDHFHGQPLSLDDRLPTETASARSAGTMFHLRSIDRRTSQSDEGAGALSRTGRRAIAEERSDVVLAEDPRPSQTLRFSTSTARLRSSKPARYSCAPAPSVKADSPAKRRRSEAASLCVGRVRQLRCVSPTTR